MVSNYPAAIDNSISLPATVDNNTGVNANVVNRLREAVIAIETELGVHPATEFTTVRHRLDILTDAVENITFSSGSPIGLAGGDLFGSYPNPQVVKINGAVVQAAGSLTSNQVLKVSGASSTIYGFILNSSIDAAAAIDGTKISPDFGNQLIKSTSSIQINSITFDASGPTITRGTGAPSSSQPNGSIYLRTDGAGPTGIYTRQSSAWSTINTDDGFVDNIYQTTTAWTDSVLTDASVVVPKTTVKTRRRQIQTTTATANQVVEDGATFGTQNFVLPDNATTEISVKIVVKKPSTGEGGSITLNGTFIRNGGGPQRVGFDDKTYKFQGSSLTGTTADLNINGNNIEVRVSPGSASTLNWRIVRVQTEGQD